MSHSLIASVARFYRTHRSVCSEIDKTPRRTRCLGPERTRILLANGYASRPGVHKKNGYTFILGSDIKLKKKSENQYGHTAHNSLPIHRRPVVVSTISLSDYDDVVSSIGLSGYY